MTSDAALIHISHISGDQMALRGMTKLEIIVRVTAQTNYERLSRVG